MCDAFGAIFMTVFIGGFVVAIGAIAYESMDSSWFWKVPLFIVGAAAFFAVATGCAWIYEKNPTIKIGGKPKAVKIPKAKVL